MNFYSSLTVSIQTNVYAVYSSPYSGAFSLLDTMYMPKPCGYISQNLTQLDYFYGQWTKEYNINDNNGGANVAQMGTNYEYVF
jgi:hypothetical protein